MQRRRSWKDYHLLFVILLTLVTIVLGYVGLRKDYPQPDGPLSSWEIFYLTLQLFPLQSGYFSGPKGWELEFARLMAPALTVYTAAAALAVVFADQVELLRLRFLSGHVVLCGLGHKGSQLAKSFLESGRSVVVIEQSDNIDARAFRQLGAFVIAGDATDEAMLLRANIRKAAHLICICGADGTNVEIAMKASRILLKERSAEQNRLACFVHITDLKLCALFKQHRLFTDTSDALNVRVFNTYESSARLLLAARPPDRVRITPTDARSVHLIVIGFGQMGESIVLHAAKQAHYANGKRLKISVLDRSARERERGFIARYPQAGQVCDIEFIEGEVEDQECIRRLQAWCADATRIASIAVCFDDDRHCLSCALTLMPYIQETQTPIGIRMAQEAGLATLLQRDSQKPDQLPLLYAFGMVDVACSTDVVINQKLDMLAQAGHEDYVRRAKESGRLTENDEAMQPWDRLDDGLKDSNRQQADHIDVKLRAVGCKRIRAASVNERSTPEFQFTPEEIELLAKMEHNRWRAERLLAGWKLGPKDKKRKISPYIVDWEELDDKIRDNDRTPVRKIPYLLSLIGESVVRCSSDGRSEEATGEGDNKNY